MTIIESTSDNVQMLTSVCYLLAMVFPSIPSVILQKKFTFIASILHGLLETFGDQAPMVKSVIQCVEILLVSQDAAMWATESLCSGGFQIILGLCLDERPKVRKRAAEVRMVAHQGYQKNHCIALSACTVPSRNLHNYRILKPNSPRLPHLVYWPEIQKR